MSIIFLMCLAFFVFFPFLSSVIERTFLVYIICLELFHVQFKAIIRVVVANIFFAVLYEGYLTDVTAALTAFHKCF